MVEPLEKIAVSMPVPQEVNVLLEAFRAFGANLYVVGGSVRDFYISIIRNTSFEPKDFDLVTEVHPDTVLKIIRSIPGVNVREVGKSFGVVLVTLNGIDFEIATFREDAKTGDGRRPDFVTFSTIDMDAARRDLTINALYYDLENHIILDFFGGIQDLHSNYIRFVGDALQRIYEDKLRILRFVRFHCRVNHDKNVDKDTKEVIRSIKLRPEISDERIRDEFLKGLNSCLNTKSFLLILEDLGLLEQIFPNLKIQTGIINFEFDEPETLVAQLLRYNDLKAVRETLHTLKYTSQEIDNICFLISLPHFKDVGEIITFKKAQKKISLNCVKTYLFIDFFCRKSIIQAMFQAPYPTVKGEQVMEETGLSGKALGDEIRHREIKNFKEFYERS